MHPHRPSAGPSKTSARYVPLLSHHLFFQIQALTLFPTASHPNPRPLPLGRRLRASHHRVPRFVSNHCLALPLPHFFLSCPFHPHPTIPLLPPSHHSPPTIRNTTDPPTPGTTKKAITVRVSKLRVEQRELYNDLGWDLPEGGAKRKAGGADGETPTPTKKPRTPSKKGGKKAVEEASEEDDGEGVNVKKEVVKDEGDEEGVVV